MGRTRFPPQGHQGLIMHGPAWQTDRTRVLYLPCPASPTVASYNCNGMHGGCRLQDGYRYESHYSFIMPIDFVSLVSIEPIIAAENNGNMVWEAYLVFAANGELCTTHSSVLASGTTAVLLNTAVAMPDLVPLFGTAFTDLLTVNDYAYIDYVRQGGDPNDTVGTDCILLGFKITYTADM